METKILKQEIFGRKLVAFLLQVFLSWPVTLNLLFLQILTKVFACFCYGGDDLMSFNGFTVPT